MKHLFLAVGAVIVLSGCSSIHSTGDDKVERVSQTYSKEFIAGDLHTGSLQDFDKKCREELMRRCTPESRQAVQNEIDRRVAVRDAQQAKEIAESEAKIRREIEGGDRSITTLEEARIYYQPLPGDRLTHSPSLSGGDGEYYLLNAYITAKKGDKYIYWWADSPVVQHGTYGMPAMGAVFTNPAFVDEDIEYNSYVSAVGKYVGNQAIPLTNGGSATVPVFDNAYIFPWQGR